MRSVIEDMIEDPREASESRAPHATPAAVFSLGQHARTHARTHAEQSAALEMSGRFASSPSTNSPLRYVLLQSDNDEGKFLTVTEGGALATTEDIDDGSLWKKTQVGEKVVFSCQRLAHSPDTETSRSEQDGFVSVTHAKVTVGAVPTPRKGPAMLGEQDVSPVKVSLSLSPLPPPPPHTHHTHTLHPALSF